MLAPWNVGTRLRGEAEVLFTLLAERYECRSVMVTSNLVFSQRERVFRDQMATAAPIDPLGVQRRRARVRRAELPNRPVRPQVAAARVLQSGYRERGDTEGSRETHDR